MTYCCVKTPLPVVGYAVKEGGRPAVCHVAHDSEGRGGTYPLVKCGDEVKELCELVDFLCPAPHSKLVMSEMVNVVSLPVVKA